VAYGGVLSYKEVAKKVGRPRAWRAAGNSLNQNRNLKIPCHRVIKSNGGVGGYRYGIKRKTTLLKKEGIIIDSHGKITPRITK